MSLSRLTLLGIACSLLALVFIEAVGMPHGPIFWHLLGAYDLPAAWLMVGMLVFGHWFGTRHSGDGIWVERLLLTLDRQRYVAAIVLWLALCAGSLWVYQNHPLSMDEYAAVFQAKVFAAGALHGQFPPDLLDNLIPPGFQNHFLMVNRDTGAVFSAYWPGFSLLLTPFVWLGIPWACNPTLVVVSFLLIGHITRDLIASPLDPAGWELPNVCVLRNVPQEALVPLYQVADLLVLPSKSEGLPLVVQEAMACGTPSLVGPDSAGAHPIEPDLIFSVDIDGPDPIALWQARLEDLLEDRKALADAREAVADFAHRSCSWETCVEAYAGIIKQLVAPTEKAPQ